MAPPASLQKGRWIRPEAYVLGIAVATGATLAFYIAGRHLISNPDVQVSKKKRQLGIADEDDLAAIERDKNYRNSGLFRAFSKMSPPRTDAMPYPGRHEEKESGDAYKNYPGTP